MLLKRLELQGFKSFVDKTVLEFGSGVTGVVGPNGSGKSNISDAIKWVMGETSAKSLRGGNMQDVIFAGTSHRKPVNYAEVSLVLDNSEHAFNVDFEEVVVTRRVFRSGETAYLINRAPCRLRDIHELFMDTGLGRDGYSMIGQGSVAQILSTKAEDRRSIFEEAAGVSKYKYKRDEATRKLTQTEENLVRINDVTAELEARIEPLKNQSEKARKYLVLYDEFKGLDVTMSVKNIDKNLVLKEEADKLYNSVSGELEALRSEGSEAEQRITALYESSSNADEELRQKNDALLANNDSISAIKNEISINDTTVKNNENDRIRTDAEIDAELARIEDKKAEIEKNKALKEEAKKSIEELDESFSDQKGTENEINERIQSIAEQLNIKRQELLSHRNEAVAGKMRIKGIDDVAAELNERRSALETESASRKRNTEETKAEIERLSEELDTKREKNVKIASLVEKARAEVEEQTALATDKLAEFNNAKVKLNSAQSKYRMLYDMEQEYDGYSRSVKTILKSDELRGSAIYGTVAGLIDVKKEYAVAVETALGGAMQNIIVEDEDDAKACIEFLRRTNGGRATFLPISSVRARTFEEAKQVSKEPGFVGIADELLNINSAYRGVISNLLGRVVVVETIDNAIAMSKKYGYKFKVVTLLGDVLNAGGSMSGGSANKSSGFLSRAAEIKELKSKIAHMEKELATKQAELAKINEALQSAKGRVETYAPTAREYENEIIKMENTLHYLEQSVESSTDGDKSIADELEELNERISKNSDETIEALSAIRTAETAAKRTEEEIEALNEAAQKAEEDRATASDNLVNYTLRLQELRRDITEAENRIESLTQEIETANNLIITKRQSIADNETNSKLLTDKNNELQSKIDEISASCDAIKQEIADIEERKAGISRELQLIQSSNKDLTDKLLRLQEELTRAENKQSKLETERENLLNHLWDEYELTYSDASASHMEEIADEKEASKRLVELKGKIRALGSVNMEAIEEYKQVSERYEFLSTQRDDLEKSKDNLNKIISSMEEMMQTHFGEQFTKIGESFAIVFRELFGGGTGRLYLSNPDDILNSGIEIEVQLPGKGMQNITLYSGGEKSFIAIAILFAILRVKPTPFCMLDEIDAALDDVNVSRFATYLKNYLDRSQFIVITHRRGTMEAANIIYGVTMQEKGVSKLLSLHIDDIQEELK